MTSKMSLTRVCHLCGKEFTARTTVTQYCGDVCAKRAYKARKRIARIEASEQETRAIRQRPIEELKAKEFLSVPEVCEVLGIGRATLYRAITAGRMNIIKLGRRTIIKRSELDRLSA